MVLLDLGVCDGMSVLVGPGVLLGRRVLVASVEGPGLAAGMSTVGAEQAESKIVRVTKKIKSRFMFGPRSIKKRKEESIRSLSSFLLHLSRQKLAIQNIDHAFVQPVEHFHQAFLPVGVFQEGAPVGILAAAHTGAEIREHTL